VRHPLHVLPDLALAALHMPGELLEAVERALREHPALAELLNRAVQAWVESSAREARAADEKPKGGKGHA
jgi:hypothetical protein